jgi:O-antigen/teichoic acid export membrane protein
MDINRRDVIWNFFSTFLRVAGSILLFPLILRMMPSEEIGIWTIFSSISSLIILLDFGFNPSFTRNVTYIFSGVSELKSKGITQTLNKDAEVDFGLLKGTINSMRWFYSRMAGLSLLFLGIIGTYYVSHILNHYSGEKTEIYIAWVLFCLINTYGLYTQYYDALLNGKGLVKVSKKISIIAQLTYLTVAAIFIFLKLGLIAIMSAQIISIVLTRVLSYKVFFNSKIRNSLNNVVARSQKEIIKAIYPNSVKVGITAIGGFLIQKASVVIGSLFLSLNDIASFGITKQLIDIVSIISGIYLSTYIPKITKWRVENKISNIREIYTRGILIAIIINIVCGGFIALFGNDFLVFIGSKTLLVNNSILLTALLVSLIGLNCGIAGGILSTKNEIPFFKASILSGIMNVIISFILLKYTNLGIIGLVLSIGIVDISYQAWKWPWEVIKELKIGCVDWLQSGRYLMFYSLERINLNLFIKK